MAHILPGPRGGVCLVLWEGQTLPRAEVGREGDGVPAGSRVTENMGSREGGGHLPQRAQHAQGPAAETFQLVQEPPCLRWREQGKEATI